MQNKFIHILVWIIGIVALIGFADAVYLTHAHYTHTIPACSLTQGCDTVLTSAYSQFFGIPVALFGVFGYISIMILCMLWIDMAWRRALWGIVGVSAVAFVVSVRFVYIQIVVLEAICQYCMVSAGTSTLLFVLSLVLAHRLRKKVH